MQALKFLHASMQPHTHLYTTNFSCRFWRAFLKKLNSKLFRSVCSRPYSCYPMWWLYSKGPVHAVTHVHGIKFPLWSHIVTTIANVAAARLTYIGGVGEAALTYIHMIFQKAIILWMISHFMNLMSATFYDEERQSRIHTCRCLPKCWSIFQIKVPWYFSINAASSIAGL